MAATPTTLPCFDTVLQANTNFNLTTGVFTVPANGAGLYQVTLSGCAIVVPDTSEYRMFILHNSTTIIVHGVNYDVSGTTTFYYGATGFVNCSVGDTLAVQMASLDTSSLFGPYTVCIQKIA